MKAQLKAVDTKPQTADKRKAVRPGTLFDPSFVYLKGSDVQRTWRRYGWQPPSEYRNDYQFKINREANLQ